MRACRFPDPAYHASIQLLYRSLLDMGMAVSNVNSAEHAN